MSNTQKSLPLEGVRVLDLSWIIAGPTATRFLAIMGAEVIKVGSSRRPDPSTRGAPFQAYNQSKLYAALNISRSEGLELAMRLVSVSDILIENFAAGVIERLGLGYEAIRQAKPDIIMLSSSGTGHSGPDKDYVAYGSLLQYYTGWNAISGYPNSEPIKGGLWADPWVGMELAMVASAALNHRAATGEGNYVDFSMAEALTASIPEALLDYQMNYRVPEPMGNADSQHSPHNVYRCKGDDRWLAIAVAGEDEWRALCTVIDRLDLLRGATLSDSQDRREQQQRIDAAISEWTQQREDYEAMHTLQNAGISAAPYLSPERVFTDPQLREGGFFSTHIASDGKQRDLPALGWRFEGGPEPRITAAPVLGKHNDYVYGELLGISDSAVAELTEQQIIY